MLKLDIDPQPRIHHLDVMTHKLVASRFMGDYPSLFKGRGVIFESFREYSPSDDASIIDWKASSRAGKALVREFADERNLDVFFLIDASHTMVFGSQDKLKHEYAAEMAAAMALAVVQQGDSVGVGLFSDKIHGFLPPDRGIAQYRRILRELTNPAHYDGECNFEEAMRACILRLRPQTILIIITDGVRLSGDWAGLLRIAGKKFDVITLLVRDPRDDELPAGCGHIAVEDPYTGEQLLIDTDSIRGDYAKAAKEILDSNLATLRTGRVVDVPIMRTDADFAAKIISYFERRKRKMR
jgi:uncharacterized protein (DUF58 family)